MPNRTLVASLVIAAGLVAFPLAARADNFVVDDPGYSADANPGDGTCADSGGKCTLNAAIQEGNVRSGSHTITFTVPVVTLQGSLAQMRAPFTVAGAFPLRTALNGYNGANHWSCFDLTDSGDIATGHFNDGANGSTIANMVIVGCNGSGISANGHGWTSLVNPATAVYGQTVSVTVQVTASSGVLPPDGGVTVTAGASTCNIVLAPVVGLVSGGSCNLAHALAAQVAPYTVSASYAGTASFAASASSGAGNGSLTVSKANTTTTITADTPDPSNVNAAYAVTVTLAPLHRARERRVARSA